ncbi:hypothetical protein [Amycolatopsis sp. Hca4]|uniref:hypothetical protein n=1 Tax=Amycolatopsis sp. Hca4 TaxID=2742131 RepID=UPI0015927819|nr:hypothetical protein [Amycolatopsis sp. Hca4]QKV75550.1 hypothetical protein HUT10_18605 [Amycolatopsis sp. Hca4]
MTENENRPEADLAHSRQLIKEAKEAAAEAHLADPAEGAADEALATDPPYHHGEQGTTPSGN